MLTINAETIGTDKLLCNGIIFLQFEGTVPPTVTTMISYQSTPTKWLILQLTRNRLYKRF